MPLRVSHQRQKGAALVISLVLLMVCLMLGISSMQSSLLDERLAGNYYASVRAQMMAEKVTAEYYQQISEGGEMPLNSVDLEADFECQEIDGEHVNCDWRWVNFLEVADKSYCKEIVGAPDKAIACFIIADKKFGGRSAGNYIVAKGAVAPDGDSFTESMPVFIKI